VWGLRPASKHSETSSHEDPENYRYEVRWLPCYYLADTSNCNQGTYGAMCSDFGRQCWTFITFSALSLKSRLRRSIANNCKNRSLPYYCELEMYFPPSFLDIMVHLMIHIVPEIIDLDPVFIYNMYALETYNGTVKRFVRKQISSRWKHHPRFYIQGVCRVLHGLQECIW
jgi:hypothetical protein